MRRLLRSNIWLWFVLFVGVELTLVCPAYALLDHYEIIELPCNDLFEDRLDEEGESCLVCVIKGSIELSSLEMLPVGERQVGSALLSEDLSTVKSALLYSIRPPPILF